MTAVSRARFLRALFAGCLVAVGLTVMAPPASAAGLTTQALGTGSPAMSATDLVNTLLGSGVTASNITYTGAPNASGSFAGGSGIVGFDTGVLLTSGHVNNVVGPNQYDSKTTQNLRPGDADLNAVSGKSTLDASVLQFDFVPTKSPVFFNYVFASDEYNEYANSAFNDAFAFLVNGANCAKIPGTGEAVTINNVNKFENSAYYRNNDLTDLKPAPINTEMDGLTTVFTCEAVVNPNVTNSVKLVVADSSDYAYDSAVFLEAGSFTPDPPNNTAPTADAGGPYEVDEGSAVTLDGAGSDTDAGDTLSYSWSPATHLDDAGLEDPTYSAVDDTLDLLTLTVTDAAGATGADDTTVTVKNVAPTITGLTAPTAPVAVNTAVSVGTTYTDPGTLDTHTASFSFGDGNSSSVGGAAGAAGTSHTYTVPGVYTLAVTVTDDDAGSDIETLQYIVVYDPDGGFVTGGGFIDSPAGAYPADPDLAGKANFGFVSKYKKGATAPTGSTEFQFHAGNLNFHSSNYEWLVISGSRAQYKGTGTINGAGAYNFLLTATDGQVNGGGGLDKFRIKIVDGSGVVVYDNQLGAGDDATPSTVLGGGSITIHSK